MSILVLQKSPKQHKNTRAWIWCISPIFCSEVFCFWPNPHWFKKEKTTWSGLSPKNCQNTAKKDLPKLYRSYLTGKMRDIYKQLDKSCMKLVRADKKHVIKLTVKQQIAVWSRIALVNLSVYSGEETPVGPALTNAWNVWDSMGMAPVAEWRGFAGCSSTRPSARAVKSAERKGLCVCVCVCARGCEASLRVVE